MKTHKFILEHYSTYCYTSEIFKSIQFLRLLQIDRIDCDTQIHFGEILEKRLRSKELCN